MVILPEPLKQSFLFPSAVSSETLSAVWQILAILAVAGLVVVVALAIIEPGPLVKRRPFSRKERRPPQTSSDAYPNQQRPDAMAGDDGEHAGQGEEGQLRAGDRGGG